MKHPSIRPWFLFVTVLFLATQIQSSAQAQNIPSPRMLPLIGPLVGENVTVETEQNNPYFCKVIITGTDEETESLCSGTLIDSYTVVTAAHCFSDVGSVQVSCGKKDVGTVLSLVYPEKHQWINSERPRPEQDVAVLHLKKYQNLPTLPFSHSESDFFDPSSGKLKPNVSCKIAGYGVNNSGGNSRLMMASLKNLSLTFQSQLIYLSAPRTHYLPTSVDHGDSGGSLFCSSPTQPQKLVGIVGGYMSEKNADSRRVYNFFAATWLNL